jgi:site-specific DNA-cytosine methylase
MLLPWQREWAPDAGRNMATGRMVLSSLPSRKYHGPDYEPGMPHIYALPRRLFADIIKLHVFRSTEAIIPPPGYEVVARVERDAAGNWPGWAQEAVERRSARRRSGASIPFGLGRISYENGLYIGPVLLYRAEEGGGFNFTGVAARPGDQPVAPPGYAILNEELRVLWGEAAEREAALNRLVPLGSFELDAPWDELPQAFMAMDVEHWELLGTSRWVQRGEPRGVNEYLLELDNRWDRAVTEEPVEGQPRPPLRTKMEGWVTVLCLFAGIGAELGGLLQAGIRIRKLLVVEIDPVARRILEFRVRCSHRGYPDQLPAVACEGLLKAMPADIRLVGGPELESFMPIHVVTVSSPCQGLSRANRNGRGLADNRSQLIGDAFRILAYLSRHQDVKPAYTFKMVDARDHPSQDARDGFTIIDRMAGGANDTAVVVDAAKLGSAAHRVRAFWTNAAPSRTLKQRYGQFDREGVHDRKEAQDILRNGRKVNLAPADDPDITGHYRMNYAGEPIRAFPTLVATAQSFAFRQQEGRPHPGRPGPGMIYDPELRGWMEPTADERELIMGMLPGSTRAPGIGEDQRRAAIGSAIDVRAYRWLCKEIRRWRALHYDKDNA